MAIYVTFYKFAKRKNSTKQPATTGTRHTCNIKDKCGVLNPRIELSIAGFPDYNYCYIPSFSRYYFVENWLYEGGLWVAELYADALGSWKNQILDFDEYVLRSASEFDRNVRDSIYPAKSGVEHKFYSYTFPNWANSDDLIGGLGCYIVGVVSSTGINYYAFNDASLFNFTSYIFTNIGSWDDFGAEADAIAKSMSDPTSYIVSAKWYPFSLTWLEGLGAAGAHVVTDATVKFGYWDSGIQAKKLYAQSSTTFTAELNIPASSADARGDWVYREPFAEYYFSWFPFGVVKLDSELIDTSYKKIKIFCTLDLITGEAVLQIAYKDSVGETEFKNNTVQIETGKIGVEFQLNANTINFVSQLTSGNWTGALGSIVGGGVAAVAGLIGGGDFGAAGNALSTVTSKGTPDGRTFTANGYSCRLICLYKTPIDDNNAEQGKPLCKRVKLNTLTGFTKCLHGDIELPATSEELRTISNYLVQGFFIE